MTASAPAAQTRTFDVHPHDDARHCRAVQGEDFHDAALEYIQEWSPAPDADGDVSLIVVDQDTGRRQCFRIDLASGDASPCD